MYFTFEQMYSICYNENLDFFVQDNAYFFRVIVCYVIMLCNYAVLCGFNIVSARNLRCHSKVSSIFWWVRSRKFTSGQYLIILVF